VGYYAEDAVTHFASILDGTAKAYTLGWGEEVDQRIVGMEPENLIVLGGENKAGKTTFAINTTYHNIKAGHKVLYVTTEITGKWIAFRLVARKLGFSIRQIKEARTALTPEQQADIYQELARLSKTELVVMDKAHPTAFDIEDAVQSHRPDIVVVDHFQRLDPNNDAIPVGYREAVQRLKQMAVTQQIPVLLLSQVNFRDGWREVDASGDIRYTIQLMGSKWSSELHGEADKVMYIDNVARALPGYAGVGHLIYHSVRDYEAEGYSILKLDYSRLFVGSEEQYLQELGVPHETV